MKHLLMLFVAGSLLVPAAGWAAEPFGTALGTSRGVTAYSNGCSFYVCGTSSSCSLPAPPSTNCYNNIDGINSIKWQCVEYARRWWFDKLGALVPTGNGCAQWGATSYKRVSDDMLINFDAEGQGRYTNGTTTIAPQAGDLVIFRDNSGNCSDTEPGHIAVVHEVDLGSMQVYLAEQNVSNNSWGAAPYARVSTLGRNGSGQYSIAPLSGHTVRGWRRSSFLCEYVDQSPSAWKWVKPGNTYSFQVRYRNKGIARWLNGSDLNDLRNVELWSCNSAGTIVNSWLDPIGWVDGGRRRATGANETNRSYNEVATFDFQARVPSSATNGDFPIYFRPTFGGLQMEDDWAGMYFPLRVDADPPDPFNASVTPPTNNVNSFSFSWTPSGDSRSGLGGYYWSVNSGPETFATGTSIGPGAYATQQGNNTLNLRAVDNVGNSISAPPVTFTLTSSPCPGREISHSPCRQPGDPCLPPMAQNLETLPDATSAQWSSVGLPVREMLQVEAKYSIGLEYRAATDGNIRLGLGNLNPAIKLGVVLNEAELPAGNGDWRPFWSAPFTVMSEQLREYPNLRLLTSKTAGIEFRNVRILSQ